MFLDEQGLDDLEELVAREHHVHYMHACILCHCMQNVRASKRARANSSVDAYMHIALYRLYLGIADGMSNARVRMGVPVLKITGSIWPF